MLGTLAQQYNNCVITIGDKIKPLKKSYARAQNSQYQYLNELKLTAVSKRCTPYVNSTPRIHLDIKITDIDIIS